MFREKSERPSPKKPRVAVAKKETVKGNAVKNGRGKCSAKKAPELEEEDIKEQEEDEDPAPVHRKSRRGTRAVAEDSTLVEPSSNSSSISGKRAKAGSSDEGTSPTPSSSASARPSAAAGKRGLCSMIFTFVMAFFKIYFQN